MGVSSSWGRSLREGEGETTDCHHETAAEKGVWLGKESGRTVEGGVTNEIERDLYIIIDVNLYTNSITDEPPI